VLEEAQPAAIRLTPATSTGTSRRLESNITGHSVRNWTRLPVTVR
jgi:hypothetical protein